MYQLTFSPISPYVRKVRLASCLIGISEEIELVNPQNNIFQVIKSKNPLAKIPVLIKKNGDYLFDSRVIIDFFNRQKGILIPEKERDLVLTRCALSEGIIDAALLFVYSNRYAGDSKPSKIWQELQISKISKNRLNDRTSKSWIDLRTLKKEKLILKIVTIYLRQII